MIRCPNHVFYEQQPKSFLYGTIQGSLISKNVKDVITIIERISLSDHQGRHNKKPSQINNGIMELNTNDVILKK